MGPVDYRGRGANHRQFTTPRQLTRHLMLQMSETGRLSHRRQTTWARNSERGGGLREDRSPNSAAAIPYSTDD